MVGKNMEFKFIFHGCASNKTATHPALLNVACYAGNRLSNVLHIEEHEGASLYYIHR